MKGWLGIVALAMLAPLPLPAIAQSTGEECAKIDDAGARMLCYDAVFRVEKSAPTISGTGKWTVRTEKSRINDKTEVFVTLPSEQVVPSRFGGPGDTAMLYLACRDNTTTLTVWFAGRFMASSGGFDRVTYRIDDQKAVNDRWTESTNNEHMGLWSGGESIPLIKALFGAENFLVQAIPFNESSLVLDFKVGGVEEAVKPLREACGW